MDVNAADPLAGSDPLLDCECGVPADDQGPQPQSGLRQDLLFGDPRRRLLQPRERVVKRHVEYLDQDVKHL